MAISETRPPGVAGPIDRAFRFLNSTSFSGGSAGDLSRTGVSRACSGGRFSDAAGVCCCAWSEIAEAKNRERTKRRIGQSPASRRGVKRLVIPIPRPRERDLASVLQDGVYSDSCEVPHFARNDRG